MLVACAAASPAQAQESVSSRRCSWLDGAELERLTRLELESVADGIDGLAIDYACGGDDVTIGMAVDKTGIRVERRITGACCDDVEPERTLALLSLGLLQAAKPLLGQSGSDQAPPPQTLVLPPVAADGSGTAVPTDAAAPMLLPPPPEPVAPLVLTPPAPVTATPWIDARRSPVFAGAGDAVEDEQQAHAHQLGLVARTRFHNLEDAVTTYGVGAVYRGFPWETVGFGASFDAHFGATDREGGDIDVRIVSLGALVAWRFARLSPFSLTAEVRGGGSLVTLDGNATAPGFEAQNVTGATGYAGFNLAPSFQSGHAELAIPIEIGGLFRAPRGRVTGSADVQVDGFWFGAGIALSLGWGSAAPALRSPTAGVTQ